MKKVVINLFLKLLIILIFLSALIIYSEFRLRELPTTYSIKKYNLEKNLDIIQVLILGSSQSFYAINPAYLSLKGFNLADQGQSLYYDKEFTLKYLKKMPKLNFVLISISYFSLWYELYNSVENWRDFFYYDIWQLQTNNSEFFDRKQISYISLFGINFTQNALLKNFNVSTGTEYLMETGWYCNKERLNVEEADTSSEAEIYRQKGSMTDEVYKNNIEYLESMIKEISNRNVLPVIFSTPLYYTYSMRTDPNKNKIITETINKLCTEYNCRYFDYSKDSRFEISDFADTDHLNELGSTKFSKIVNEEIITHFDKFAK